ncbi:uncharacterized protein LOC142608987 [Castanea sativa]|uniref:uncharacterized protein LOC142608987 n=1 Tax=Castanea sativa TaxID=21020 RepID=UPI003F6510FF
MAKANMKCSSCVCDNVSMSIFGDCPNNELLELFKSRKHARMFIHMLKCLKHRNQELHNRFRESTSLVPKYKKMNRHLCNKLDSLKRKLQSSMNDVKKDESCFENQECSSHACLFVHTTLKVFNSCLWYLDSGCSRHIIGDKSLFKSLKKKENGYVTFGDRSHSQVLGKGTIDISGLLLFTDVLYIKGLKANLLSITQIYDKDFLVQFSKKGCLILNEEGVQVLKGLWTTNNCYGVVPKPNVSCQSARLNLLELWHQHFGHATYKQVVKVSKLEAVIGLPKFGKIEKNVFGPCQLGKQTKSTHPKVNVVAKFRPLELLHEDLMGPTRMESKGGKRENSEASDKVERLRKKLQNEKGVPIVKIRSEHGKEFKHTKFEAFCNEHGIKKEFSTPKTPQQNGVVERKNRVIQEMARKQAPRAWYNRLTSYLLDHGFKRGQADRTFFVKRDDKSLLVAQVYVDDIVFGSTIVNLAQKVLEEMKKEFEMSMVGELNYFLGLQVKQWKDGIFISQKNYAKNLVKRFNLDSKKHASTPMSSSVKLSSNPAGVEVDPTLYRSMIGGLLYLIASMPDIAFSVGVCAHFQAAPKDSHMTMVKRIIWFVNGTSDYGIWYSRDLNDYLVGHSDADWAEYVDDRKSTSRGCFYLGNNLVSWMSKKQNLVSLSTAEAEHIIAGSCCAQLLWMKKLLHDYGISQDTMCIFCDNTSAINLSKNSVQHSKSKHIEIRYHFIRDLVEEKIVWLEFINIDNQKADIFTKPFDGHGFESLR